MVDISMLNLCPSKLQHLAMRLMFYWQIHQWKNRKLDPINFGWELSEEKYRPIQGQEQLCPRELLKKLCCNSKTDCSTKRCCCKQVWLDDAYSRDRDAVGRYHVLHNIIQFKNNETNVNYLMQKFLWGNWEPSFGRL